MRPVHLFHRPEQSELTTTGTEAKMERDLVAVEQLEKDHEALTKELERLRSTTVSPASLAAAQVPSG